MRAVVARTLFLVTTPFLVAGTWAGQLDVADVDPRHGSIDRGTDVVVSGAGFDPAARAILSPGGPAFAGLSELPGSARDVVIADRYAYVADHLGLRIVDILDPHAPEVKGSLSIAGARALEVSGRFAFVLDDRSRFRVVDATDPADPRWVETLTMSRPARDVVVAGRFAYVAGDSGLLVIDVGKPDEPTLVGNYYGPYRPVGVAVSGDHAYVADGARGLWVVDVRDPTAPVHAARYNTSGSANDVAVRGDHAYVADGDSGLLVLDVSDPARPTYVTNHMTYWSAARLALAGNQAHVATDMGLQILDISDPAAPVFSRFIDMADPVAAVAARWGYDYLALPDAGLRIVDLNTAPRYSHPCDTPGLAWDVTVAEGRAYVTDHTRGVQVIDLDDPTAPSLAAGCDTPGEARGVALSGDLAFVADYGMGLQVIDFSDLENPRLIGDCGSIGRAWDVAVAGAHAYVAVEAGGIRVIDVGDPAGPSSVGRFDTPGYAVGAAVSDGHLYVADHIRGLRILSLADPVDLVPVGSYDTPGAAVDVALEGGYAYVADHDRGLQVIDVSDPERPNLAAGLELPGVALGITVSGERAYVAGFGLGLQVVDVSDPTRPVAAERFADLRAARKVAVVEPHAFVTDGYSGLQIVRMNPPLENVVAPSSEILELTVPAAMITGPYNLLVVNPDGSRLELLNAYRACEARELDAAWLPDAVPGEWILEIGGDPSFLDPESRHRAVMPLPPLPSRIDITTASARPDEPASIDLLIDRQSDSGRLRLVAEDADWIQRLWRSIRDSGEIPLPRLDDRSYGRLRLEGSGLPLDVAGGQGGIQLARYRFEFAAARLTAIQVGGQAELRFAVTGLDEYHCETQTDVSFE